MASHHNSQTQHLCLACNMKFVPFETQRGKLSTRCTKCNTQQKQQDEKRKDRQRNFKAECMKRLDLYYQSYKRNAVKRDYEYTIDLDTFTQLVQSSCHYCNHKIDDEVNGIDRVDNSRGYTKDNCVSCCEMCNRLKLHYELQFFLDKMYIFATSTHPNSNYYDTWNTYYNKQTHVNHDSYKKQTHKRDMTFELSHAQYTELINGTCYLCGYTGTGALGIDRVDNTIRSYTADNCKSCCKSCNIMKATYSLDELRKKAASIVEHLSITRLSTAQSTPYSL